MARVLVNWEHAEDRNFQRVKLEYRSKVQQALDLMTTLEAPPEALGHYTWFIEIYGNSSEVIAILVCRGIAVRTVYSPEKNMRPPVGATKFRIDKVNKKIVKV